MFNQSKYWLSILCICVVLGVLLVAIMPVHADIVTVPEGLTLGDQYRLAFVTITPTDAVSSDLADYNGIVNADVAGSSLSALGASWTAFVATYSYPDPHANTSTEPHLVESLPIYNLHGETVAANYTELWSGGLEAPIAITANGVDTRDVGRLIVWTGIQSIDGQVNYMGVLGSEYGGAWYGWSDEVGTPDAGGQSDWHAAGWESPLSVAHSLYAISSTLTVVPIPAAIWLFGSGLVALFVLRRKGRNA